MSRIERFRQSVDGTLDRWQVKAEAMEAHLDASKEQASERVESAKKAYLSSIDKAKAGIAASKSLADTEKQRIQTKLDETRVQFALGKADTEDEFNKQRDAIKAELAKLEKEIDSGFAGFDDKVDESLDHVARDLVKAGDALHAEIDATAATIKDWKAWVKTVSDDKVAEAKSDLAAFKEKISATRADTSKNADAFRDEFDAGWKQIKSAFKNLK